MPRLSFENIRKTYGALTVLDDLNLRVEDGDFLVLLGPSGCGKTTLLNLLAGLSEVTDGRIVIGERDVTDLDPKDRGLAMVFQSYALYPTKSVRGNLRFGLASARLSRAEVERRVEWAARLLQIEPLLDRRPSQLSGGQRQRVAIGRALVKRAEVMLFDEPLSNLDAKLRTEMRLEIKRLHDELSPTVVYVTHDQIEAMTMATRIAVMNGGVIQQFGTPDEIYERPANLFVAGFIGAPNMNFFETTARDGRAELPGGLTVPAGADGPVTVGIRPQSMHLARDGEPGMEGRVTLVEALGAETVVHATAPGGKDFITVLAGQPPVRQGETIRVTPDEGALHRFGADGLRQGG